MAANATAKESTKKNRPKWGENAAWSLERLWVEGAKPRAWIVWPLFAVGEQVILAGEPKSGKSLLASQLCLEIAKGPGETKLSRPKLTAPQDEDTPNEGVLRVERNTRSEDGKWTVLYVSFEMRAEAIWERTRAQAEGLQVDLLAPKPTAEWPDDPKSYTPGTHKSTIPLFFLFELGRNKKRTLAID